MSRAERRKEIANENIVELIDYETSRSSDFCSNYMKLYLIYEYHPNTLDAVMAQ